MPEKEYDVNALRRLWNDHTMRPEDVAKELGISTTFLRRLALRHHLPRRPVWRDRSDNDAPDAVEELLSQDSLQLSPWVRSRIEQLRLGMPSPA